MTLPVTIPNQFANATSSIPLSQLDSNFNTLSNVINQINAGTQQLSNANVATLIVTGNATIGDASSDTVTLNSTLTANTAVIFTAGTSAAPSITTTGDTNTGIFFPAADTIAFAEGGAEAMRIDSSGRVGIGTTNPGFKLDITDATTTTEAGGIRLTLGSEGRGHLITNTTPNASSGRDLGVLAWRDLTLEAGNGTTEGVARLNSYEYTAFGTGSSYTERMRIDSSGNLLVGTTSNNGRLVSKASTANGSSNAFYASNSSDTVLCSIRSDGLFSTGLAANSPYNYTTGSAANTFLNSSGELQRSTSSLKYKTDIQNATYGLAEVMSLRPVTYKGKNDGDKIFGGLIAEEVDAIGLTEFVQYAEDGSPDALHYGNMVSLAFKAIQELKAELDTVKAELATLKG